MYFHFQAIHISDSTLLTLNLMRAKVNLGGGLSFRQEMASLLFFAHSMTFLSFRKIMAYRKYFLSAISFALP